MRFGSSDQTEADQDEMNWNGRRSSHESAVRPTLQLRWESPGPDESVLKAQPVHNP